MPLTGMTDVEIADLEAALLKMIPDDGSIGNQSLREASGLADDLYLAVRNRLRDSGRLVIGRGRGGSIRKTVTLSDVPSAFVDEPRPETAPPCSDWEDEASLYPPMLEVLSNRWVQDQPFSEYVFEDTSRGGRRPDGKWARPDLTCVAMTTYSYVPNKYFDVVTFEVKPSWSVDLTAVYEALSHRRRATRAYVLFHVPSSERAGRESVLADICQEAAKHGIGVIVAEDPANYDTWDFLEDAARVEPDPAQLNRFLQEQLPQDTLNQMLKWFR